MKIREQFVMQKLGLMSAIFLYKETDKSEFSGRGFIYTIVKEEGNIYKL